MREVDKDETIRLLRELAQQLEAIVDSGYPDTEKLILIKVRLRCDHGTLAGAYPSIATLMRSASTTDDRSIRKKLKKLVAQGPLSREDRQGLSSVFGFSREQLQALVTDYVVRSRGRKSQERPLPSNQSNPSWTSPEGWMMKPLSDINAEAMQKKQVTAARVERAKSSSAPPRGKSRRAELDEA